MTSPWIFWPTWGLIMGGSGLILFWPAIKMYTHPRDETPPQGPQKPVTKPPAWQKLDDQQTANQRTTQTPP